MCAAAKSLQSCPTLCDPTDGSPPRLPRPWDSPGKNTGVGCHFLLQCMKVKSESEVAQPCPTLSDPKDCSLPGSSVHRIFQARVLEWLGTNNTCMNCVWLHFFKSRVISHGRPLWLSGKESACNAGDVGLIPRSGRSPGEGNGNPLQYSCLGNPVDRGAWGATVHGVAKELDTT